MRMGAVVLSLIATASFGQLDSSELVALANKFKVLVAKDSICQVYMRETNSLIDNYERERNTTSILLAKDSVLIGNFQRQQEIAAQKEREYLNIIDRQKPSWFEKLFEHPVTGAVLGFVSAYFIFHR